MNSTVSHEIQDIPRLNCQPQLEFVWARFQTQSMNLVVTDAQQHHQQHKPTLWQAHAVASHLPQASFCELTGVHHILATAYGADDPPN